MSEEEIDLNGDTSDEEDLESPTELSRKEETLARQEEENRVARENATVEREEEAVLRAERKEAGLPELPAIEVERGVGGKAYRFLVAFEETFAQIPSGEKWLPQMGRIATAIHNNRGDILGEICRAENRGRC